MDVDVRYAGVRKESLKMAHLVNHVSGNSRETRKAAIFSAEGARDYSLGWSEAA
jgi:hypothetical protein